VDEIVIDLRVIFITVLYISSILRQFRDVISSHFLHHTPDHLVKLFYLSKPRSSDLFLWFLLMTYHGLINSV